MKLKVNSQDLQQALDVVTKAIAARPAKAVLEGVLMDACEDTLTLTCSDGNLSIQSVIDAEIEEGGRTVMPGKLFTDLVRKLPGGTVELSIPNRGNATIRCLASKFTLTVMNAAEYPEMAHMEEDSVQVAVPQILFRDMISHVVFAIAQDETRQILTGCLLELTAEEARLVALDGYRLAMQKLEHHFDLPEGRDLFRAVIPGRVLNELSRIMADSEDEIKLEFDSMRMQAVFGRNTLNTVLLAGEYIDYRKILPPSFRTTVKAARSSVSSSIDYAAVMANIGKNNTIRMSISNGSMTIASNSEMGDVLDTIECELTGSPLDIAFNAKYISDVIRNISDDQLCMNFNSNVSPCVFLPQEGDRYLYLILPVRVFSN